MSPRAAQSNDGNYSIANPTITPTTFTTTSSSTINTSTYIATTTPATNPATVGSSSSQSSNHRSNGVSSGLLAGVAIGAAAGAAIIAALITWMLLRSKTRSGHRTRSHRQSHADVDYRKDATEIAVTEMRRDQASQAYRWEQHLPQPADDSSLRFSAKTLFHQIELHVENFYVDTESRSDKTVSHDIMAKLDQFDSNQLPAPIAVLMQQGKSPVAVIKHCLVKYIISRIDVPEGHRPSFLSTEYTVLAGATRDRTIAGPPGAQEAFSQWRVLTAYLRPEVTDTPISAKREAVIKDAAKQFSKAFAPWAAPRQSDAQRVQNLEEILRNAAHFGDLIFSQASSFQYIWDAASNVKAHGSSQSRNNGIIVVSPGLVKLTDQKSQPLRSGQVIVGPVTAEF